MPMYRYTENLQNFLGLFNIFLKEIDRMEYYLDESIDVELFHYFDYKLEEKFDEIHSHITYKKSIIQAVLDEIESFLDCRLSTCFESKIKFNILPYEYNDKVEFTIESDNLQSQIGQGMNGYGMWSWELHSPEDKQKFVDDGYLALRELLHYYEACESKPHVKLDNIDLDNLWEFDTSVDKIKEELGIVDE